MSKVEAVHYDSSASFNPVQTSRNARRALLLKNLHTWHWISSALCLLGMLLFSFTGITLNHATQIEAEPSVVTKKGVLPPTLHAQLRTAAGAKHDHKNDPLPLPVRQWISNAWSIEMDARPAEWSQDEIYLSLPRPGGDAWLRIGLDDGAMEYERTDRGWISWLNDLHKGRNTGTAWNWFIDIFAAGCLIFSITGLLILKFHAAKRPLTWPIVGLGILVPILLALLLIH